MYGQAFMAGLVAASCLIIGCTEVNERDVPRIKAEIEAAVTQAARAWEEFPKTLDRTAILKHYAPDYSGVKDGESETLKDLEKSFADLAEQIKLGAPIGVSYKITGLDIQILTGRLAWVTYQDETKWGRSGLVVRDDKTKCSTLVRKEKDTWLVFHEHCSTVKNGFPLGRLR